MNIKATIQHSPARSYFILTFFISWLGALLLVASKLINKEKIPKMDGILMFPVMLAGPAFSGILLTRIVDGKIGLQNLFARMHKTNFNSTWYVALLIPPTAIFIVLFLLSTFISTAFTPNFFLLGIAFGVPAGVFEEIGWMGFAFPKLQSKYNAFKAAFILGTFWGLWHLPVIDFLGAASPHGKYLIPFFISFVAAMSAMRILIVWLYVNTKSILLCQLMHISSTGFLVMFGPFDVTPLQETIWYAAYAVALWIIALIVAAKFRKNLNVQKRM